MGIRFTCPKCSRTLQAPDGQAGVRTKCPSCGDVLTIPSSDHASLSTSTVGSTARAKAAVSGERGEADSPVRFRPTERSDSEVAMDMTPMVDVTFLLLIFFMVTAAFSLQKAIQVPPSKEEASINTAIPDVRPDENIRVRIDADNVYWVSSPVFDAEREAHGEFSLLAELREAQKPTSPGGQGPITLMVLASGDARHHCVVTALDAGTAIGMEEVKLATFDEEYE